MFVAWTTTAKRAVADRLARGAVEARLAACAQVDGPVTSYYHWEGKLESAEEFRVWFKYLPANASALSRDHAIEGQIS
jgi:periplasmic divalent cation tolerance protein